MIFRTEASHRAGVLNFSVPGDFEASMPSIVEWFAEHPPGDAWTPSNSRPRRTA